MLKKFQSSDVFVNRIKAYPKVKIFTYSGSMYYNDSVVSGSGIKLFDFLMEPLPTAPVITGPVLLFTETYEYPDWFGTYDTGSIVIPTFSGTSTFTETYEYPDWFGTYDTGSIVVPSFTGSAIFTETFESGSWPGDLPIALTYTASDSSPTIDNRQSQGGTPPPATIQSSFTISATGTGTETLSISVTDYSSMGDSITVSFDQFSQVSSTTINGGSSVTLYINYTDSGANFIQQSADLLISSSGGNTTSPNPIVITALPYNYFEI